MSMNKENQTEELQLEDCRLELENRIRNLLWTVSGDYTLEMKPDVSLFLRSQEIALYDGIKQGAFAKFFDKEMVGLYLVKKIYLQADERSLTVLAQLCIEEAIGPKICQERPGIVSIQKKAFEDILEQEYEELPSEGNVVDRLRIAVIRTRLDGEQRFQASLEKLCGLVEKARTASDTMELIGIIDALYNQ